MSYSRWIFILVFVFSLSHLFAATQAEEAESVHNIVCLHHHSGPYIYPGSEDEVLTRLRVIQDWRNQTKTQKIFLWYDSALLPAASTENTRALLKKVDLILIFKNVRDLPTVADLKFLNPEYPLQFRIYLAGLHIINHVLETEKITTPTLSDSDLKSITKDELTVSLRQAFAILSQSSVE